MSSNNLSEIQAQWVTVRSKIRQKIGDAQFASWIKLLTLESYSDQKVTLSVPSNFIRTRIIEQYLDIIKSYWYVQNLRINDIKIIVIEKNKLKSDDLEKKKKIFMRKIRKDPRTSLKQ
jgi:chromosomal replication initiation ATPase DnaA